MAKPVITTFAEMGEMIIQKYERYLPTAFDDSLTMLEKVNKVIDYLNKIGDLTNDVVKQWNEVMVWVTGTGMNETIKIELDKMIANGTFDTIINQTLLGNINAKINSQEINVQYPPTVYLGEITPPLASANGDGIVDDYLALQAILDFAVLKNHSVFFPKGKYRITQGLKVQYTDATKWQVGIKIYGESPATNLEGDKYGSIIAPTNDVTTPAFSVTGVANSDNSYKGQVNGMTIENLGILGQANGANGDGWHFKYYTNLTLRNVWSLYNKNGFNFARQANSAGSYGYGYGVTLDRIFALGNREWGLKAQDAGSVQLTLIDPTLQLNTLGGMLCAGSPVICYAGGFYGNLGPAVVADDPTGVSTIFGPHFYGTRFESNNTATKDVQVKLLSASVPIFDGCWFLTSTNGEHGISMGEDLTKTVYRPTLRNCLFNGKTAETAQKAYLIGNNCQSAVIENCRELNYTNKFGGVAGLKADIFYLEKGNQLGNDINVVLPSIARAFGANLTDDSFPRFSINTNGDLSWGVGTSATDISLSREQANRLTLASGDSFRVADGTWNGGKLIMGSYRLWVDATGILRMKNGDPTTDIDGVVVGSQV